MLKKPEKSKANLERLQANFYKLGSLFFFLLITAGIFYIASGFAEIINIIGFSILISYLLIGLVDWLQEKLKIKKRGLIVALVYLLILLLVIIFFIFVLPKLADQLSSLAKQTPAFFSNLESNLSIWETRFSAISIISDSFENISLEITRFLTELGKDAVPKLLNFAFETINFAIYFLVCIVLSVYFLLDGPKIWHGLIKPLSPKYKKHAEKLRFNLSRCLRGYFVGQVQLASLSGIFVFILYLILGSKYALLLGIWQALIEIIPVVGGFLGIGLGVLVLLFSSPIKALIALILYMTYTQIIKDNFLTPRIMGNAINLHPVVILLVVLIGAKAGGVSGVVFALPVAGLLNVVLDYIISRKKEESNK